MPHADTPIAASDADATLRCHSADATACCSNTAPLSLPRHAATLPPPTPAIRCRCRRQRHDER
jgi:hypothetical protein